MCLAVDEIIAAFAKAKLQGIRAFLMLDALFRGLFQDFYGAQSPRSRGRRNGCREDKARRHRAHSVNHNGIRRDVPANHAVSFGERTLDNVDAVHEAPLFGDAAALRAVHANRVDFVNIGQRAIFIC